MSKKKRRFDISDLITPDRSRRPYTPPDLNDLILELYRFEDDVSLHIVMETRKHGINAIVLDLLAAEAALRNVLDRLSAADKKKEQSGLA